MTYLYIYLIIGFIIGAGTGMYVRSMYNNAELINKILMAKKYSCNHWGFYIAMIISRMIAWPIYVVAELLTKMHK